MELKAILPAPALVIQPDVIYFDPDSYKFTDKESENLQTLLQNSYDLKTQQVNFLKPNYSELYFALLKTKQTNGFNRSFTKFLLSPLSLEISSRLFWLAVYNNLSPSYSSALKNLKSLIEELYLI